MDIKGNDRPEVAKKGEYDQEMLQGIVIPWLIRLYVEIWTIMV